MPMTERIDPRLEPSYIESELAAKARGLRRRCVKLANHRKTLMKMLRLNHEKLKQYQEKAINAERQLFEQRELIQKIEVKKERKKPIKKSVNDNDIMRALDSMSSEQKRQMIDKLISAGVINADKKP